MRRHDRFFFHRGVNTTRSENKSNPFFKYLTLKIPSHLYLFRVFTFASKTGGLNRRGTVEQTVDEDEGVNGHSLHTLTYGIEEWRGAPRLLGSLLTAHSHLERLTHESVVKREDDPIDEVCCDKSLTCFFFFFSFCVVFGLNSA